jgi:beta-lactam-binding protein with PASTA domain/tRNA A-37 threonylcarbamoyl transferase component Bud32
MADEPPVFSDRYEMVQHIARGGMAQVYLARDLLLDRPVALKVLFPELSVDRSFVERFRREAKAAANLSHPNIVSIYDWGQGDQTYYIVMEYVDGPTLSSMLRPREGTSVALEPERAASIAASVAAALDFAHRRGVIHRDVKPGNVLIDDRGQVKVADFGIARAIGASEDLTQTGSVMGTATYFSPEQAQGYPVDPRSDVYSLGVVLYEMVTGKPPFSGENPVSIAYKHVKEPPPRPSSVNPAVPAALEAIILKAMAKDPDGRYQSAEDMRADLVRFTSGQPVAALAALGAATSVMGTVGGEPTRVQTAAAGVASTTVQPAFRGAPPPERSRTGLYALIAVIVAALLLGGYFGGRQAGLFGSSTKTLTVPKNLAGQPVSNAQSELSGMGFTNVKTTNQASSTVAANDVISSTPAGGAKMKSNAPLTLLVSGGPVLVTVPSVAGQVQSTADAALDAAGFKTADSPQYSTTVPQGTVISTDPAGNTKAAQGSLVKVAVSNGQQPVVIPPVAGDSQSQAGATLAAAGLKVGPTVQQPSANVPQGQVSGTNPAAGTTVPTGTTVTILVSSGPPTVSVPNLVGDTAAQAQAALSGANLQGQNTGTVTVTDPNQNGLVQKQTPGANQSVPQGSTVQYQVGQYNQSSTTTTTTPTSTLTSP